MKKISVTNFRKLENKTTLNIKPISIVTGENNSGKSTFIKAVKILAESAQKSNLLYLLRSPSETLLKNINSIENTKNIQFELVTEIELPFFKRTEELEVSLSYENKGEDIYFLEKLDIAFKKKKNQKKPIKILSIKRTGNTKNHFIISLNHNIQVEIFEELYNNSSAKELIKLKYFLEEYESDLIEKLIENTMRNSRHAKHIAKSN